VKFGEKGLGLTRNESKQPQMAAQFPEIGLFSPIFHQTKNHFAPKHFLQFVAQDFSTAHGQSMEILYGNFLAKSD